MRTLGRLAGLLARCRIPLAICIALPLLGCIKSKGPLIASDQASTPLPAGAYYTLGNLNAGATIPTLRGPAKFQIRGNGYWVMPTEPDEKKPIRFHLIKLPDAGNLYVLQTDEDDNQGYRDVLIGVVGKDGFCSKDIRDFPAKAVMDHAVVSGPILLRWLVEQAASIATMPNEVCFVRKL